MKVVLTGGGTGGHIYPALALVNEIKRQFPDTEFLYIGSEKGLEKDIVGKAGIPFVSIDISGFRRKLSVDNIKTVIRFLKSTNKSKQYLKGFNPDIVIGTGGFVCGPVLYAASRINIPTIIHEQNVIPGLTNKFLSRFVKKIAISFEGSKKYFKGNSKVVLTGNPRATEVVNADKKSGYISLNIEENKKVVLIFGGSRGAKAINQAFLEMAPELHKYKDLIFVFITGEVHYPTIRQELEVYNKAQLVNIMVYPYIYNMPEILAITDLNVSRAGASTLAEVTALGIPSILIPSPYVTNNHQELNARWMEEQGSAIMIKENDLTGAKLLSTILYMMGQKDKFSLSAKKIGKPEAAKLIVNEMLALLKNKNR